MYAIYQVFVSTESEFGSVVALPSVAVTIEISEPSEGRWSVEAMGAHNYAVECAGIAYPEATHTDALFEGFSTWFPWNAAERLVPLEY